MKKRQDEIVNVELRNSRTEQNDRFTAENAEGAEENLFRLGFAISVSSAVSQVCSGEPTKAGTVKNRQLTGKRTRPVQFPVFLSSRFINFGC